jgi:hypothetical protein
MAALNLKMEGQTNLNLKAYWKMKTEEYLEVNKRPIFFFLQNKN